jgi:hypothetical protein
MKPTRVGISVQAKGRLTRSVPRGASCVCDSSSSAALISEKMRRQRSRNRPPSAVRVTPRAAVKKAHAEPFLHPGYRLADRRRRNTKLPSRDREASGFRRLNKGIQRSQAVHPRVSISDNQVRYVRNYGQLFQDFRELISTPRRHSPSGRRARCDSPYLGGLAT